MRRIAPVVLALALPSLACSCATGDGESPPAGASASGASGAAAGAGGAAGEAGTQDGEAGGTSGLGGAGGSGGTGAAGSGGAGGGDGGASGGSAGAGGCDADRADCNGIPADGCEIDLRIDPSNCGACGEACTAPDHAVPTCSVKTCGFECMPTHADCDADPSNGCEVTLGSDTHNCGSCGHECPATGGDKAVCVGAVCDTCPVIQFSIETMQACAISVLPGFALDAEAFVNVGGTDHRVFAMDRWGNGHVVGWCDGTTTHTLLQSFNVLSYLGQTASPKVASVGDQYLCKPGSISQMPSSITWLGQDLPAAYKQNAAQLAADWDVIIFCGFRIPWTTDWTAELTAFVADHGKGLLAVMEYEGVAQPQDFQNMSAITQGDGIVFEQLNLPWAPASTNVLLDCVPDVE